MKRYTKAEVARHGAYVEWVKAREAEKQRDQLAEALREMLGQFDAEECTRNEADYMAVKQAHAALQALEDQ